MKKTVLLSVLSLLLIHLTIFSKPLDAAESIHEIRFIAEHDPPFNYVEDDKLKGIFIEMLIAAARRMDSPLSWDRVSFLPPSRGYISLAAGAKKCLLGAARTPEQAPLFKWTDPVVTNRLVLVAKAETPVRISSLDRIRSLRTGVIRDDRSEQTLTASGIPPESLFFAFADEIQTELIQGLADGRMDLWAHPDLSVRWWLKKSGLPPKNFRIAYVVQETNICFAFSRDVSDDFISGFQKALNRIKKDGTLRKVLHRYLSEALDPV